MDAAARCLRGKTEDSVDAAFDACRKALGTTATTIETTKLVSYRARADLDLPAPGYGWAAPRTTRGRQAGPHPQTGPPRGTALPRPFRRRRRHEGRVLCLCVLADAHRRGFERAALTAAFQLPDDGDLTPGRRLFTALDEDGNGCLGRAELARGLARLGASITKRAPTVIPGAGRRRRRRDDAQGVLNVFGREGRRSRR